MPARPMLGDLELQQVQQVMVADDQVFVRSAVPGLDGDFTLRLGRRASVISVSGVITGAEAGARLKELRTKFRAAEPVTFVSDVATATQVGDVLIEEMRVVEMAGRPLRFGYAFTLRGFTPPPPPQTEPPPPPPEPPPTPPTDTGTLEVEVVVEGQPGFDFSTVTVTVEGTTRDGSAVSRTETDRVESVWTDSTVPPGKYTAKAVNTGPPAMSGSAEATVPAGGTARVTITLRPGAVVAEAFLVHFRFDKAFVEPCLRPVLRQVAAYAADHTDQKLVIVGHTDKTGGDDYNQALSERRARSVFAYLTAGRAGAESRNEWAALRRPPTTLLGDDWGVREAQHILQALAYYPGPIDGDAGVRTDAAVREFQQDRGLGVDGVIGDETWTALIDAYLADDPPAVAETAFLRNARGGCDGGTLQWLGCGEQDPVKNTEDAWRPNRRVELLFVAATEVSCDMPRPATFDLPSSGTAGTTWCLDPSGSGTRCCMLTRDAAVRGKWLVQPSESGQVRVHGSVTLDDGGPAAGVGYALIAPDGEFLDGERPVGAKRGEPVPGHTGADGTFAYPGMKRVGVYVFEVLGPFVARLADAPAGTVPATVVCKRLDEGAELAVVLSPSPTGDPRRELRGVIHDRFGEPLPGTELQATFVDGTRATAVSNEAGEFVVTMDRPQERAKLRYRVGTEPDDDVVLDVFVDVQSIETDEGVRRRLHNLGCLVGDDVPGALLIFQATHGLDTTGEVDAETRVELAAVHDGTQPLTPEFDVPFEKLGPEDLVGEGGV